MPNANGYRRCVLLIGSWMLATGAAPAWAGTTTEIKVGQTTVGTFTVDIYQADPIPNVSYGIAVGGVFTPDPGYTLPTGYEYRWIQTVQASIPSYSWQVPTTAYPSGEYVDRTRLPDGNQEPTLARSQSPFYNDGLVDPSQLPSLPFADNPSRPVGADTFRGVWNLSLVAVEAADDPSLFNQAIAGSRREIYEIATFSWGFNLTNGSTITLLPIQPIGVDPQRLSAAFRFDPDQETFGDDAWVIKAGLPGSATAIPEPGSFLLAASAAVIGAASLRMARRRA